MLPEHQQHNRVARGALALATRVFATTMRAWIVLLIITERLGLTRRRKARVLERAGSPTHRVGGCVAVTVTGPELESVSTRSS
jgi:hypothetical protein